MSEIVLLETESEFDNIKCISIPFDDSVPEYYAISYRWGVHPEWKAQTPNYTASITSVSQGNLIKLCKLYRSKIRYLWIDVICINQADKFHRKMAIKNMDNIYRRAKRIVAVPDLCYCDQNPHPIRLVKEEILCAVKDIWSRQMELFPYGYRKYLGDDHEDLLSSKGAIFIYQIVQDWASRCWVISERTIGVNGKKMDMIIISANVDIPYLLCESFFGIDWYGIVFGRDLITTIIYCKSTKYIDRLFAIFPHTIYKDLVPKLVDENRTIDNMTDLKKTLLDIVDCHDKLTLLYIVVADGGYQPVYLSLDTNKKHQSPMSHSRYCSDIQAATRDGKPAVQVSGPYTTTPLRFIEEPAQPDIEFDSELYIVLYNRFYEGGGCTQECLRCLRSNGVWVLQPIAVKLVVSDELCKHGEFVLSL